MAKEQRKPALLWAWNYISLIGKGGKGATDPAVAKAEADPLGTLLAYPLDAKPREPTGIMPLTWEAVDMGQYVFRNGWTNKDDCIVQVFLKAHTIGGWNGPNAGTFRVQAFGTEWAVGGPHDRTRCRWEECVVMPPANPEINQGTCSRATYYRAEKDGSGSLSIDMNDVYATRSGDRSRLYERYGNIRQGGWADSVAGKEIKKPIHGVFAEGGDDFVVIVTIQKGDAPQVKVEGSGLDAKVTVGGQRVKFDGQKVVFGEWALTCRHGAWAFTLRHPIVNRCLPPPSTTARTTEHASAKADGPTHPS